MTCSEAEIDRERDYLDTMRTIRGLAEADAAAGAAVEPNVVAPLEQYEDVLAGGPGSRPRPPRRN